MEDNKEKNTTSQAENKTKKKAKRHFGWIVAVALFVLVVGAFSAYSAAYSKVLPNVSVSGVKVGGLSVEDAERKIEVQLGKVPNERQLTFKCDGKTEQMEISELVTEFDNEASANKAFEIGRNTGAIKKILTMFTSLFRENEISACVKVDDEVLENLIEKLAGDLETPMVETHYELDGNTMTIIKGEPGEMVDREKVRKLLADAADDEKVSEITLVVEKTKPHKVDADKFYEEMTKAPQNAEYKFENGEVIIVPHRSQVKVDKKKIVEALNSSEKETTLTVNVIPAEVTKEELEEMLFRDVLGTYTTNFATSSASRANNVSLTAERINGYILMPGDEFSYDKTVGERTLANGYKEAGVYIGNKMDTGIGGGICQTSSTLYSAALYANIEIVRRTSHSLPVSYVPAGQDATIAQGYIDLVLKNNTDYPVKIVATINGRNLTCSFLGVKVPNQTVEVSHSRYNPTTPEVERTENPQIPEGYKKIVEKGAPGYSVASRRIVKIDGKVVKDEKLSNSVYHALNTVEEVNPKDKDTPTESLKIYNEEQYKKEQEALAKQEAEDEKVPEDIEEKEEANESETEVTEIETE